jgi:aspartate aminotransferase-like enzyme
MGAQKALSAPPDAAMIAVSERAWTRIERVAYAGYDALAPWRNVGPPGSFPYTPSWHATAAIHTAAGLVLAEGLDAVFHRHTAVAAHCRDRARALGLELFPENEAAASPTVTGLRVPRGWTWDRLDGALREHGVALGGNWGELAGKVFRIGHMGDQARADLVDSAFDVLEKLLRAET